MNKHNSCPWALVVVLLVLSVQGCTDRPAEPVARSLTLEPAGPIPETVQRSGNPARGRAALLNEDYVGCGLPTLAWQQLSGDAEVVVARGRNEASQDLPYFLNAVRNADGVELVVNNCLTCHGASLFGDLVIGLGNEFADFTNDPSVAIERAGLLVNGEAEIAAWEQYADRVAAIAPHIQLPTVGSNPANNLTFAVMAYRDPETHAWSEIPLLPLPTQTPPPVSVPPWWRMSKKHAMFNLGEGRGDHARFMMAASMMCTDDKESLRSIDAYAPDVRAFIAGLEPPAWPFDIDELLAAEGEEIFNATCNACHGSYGDQSSSYPNTLVDIDVVGTDPALMEQARDEGERWVDWFSRSFYGEGTEARPGRGYVAPPLDGIWATSPYLHNGSVPTIEQLLDSPSRPERWMLLATDGNDPELYDTARLGWRHVSLSDTKAAALASDELKRVYDTTRYGHGKNGHRFGDHFSRSERNAVLEYLKTL